MTKKLNWRLSKLPTPDEVRELVKDKIITQDEAREILFKTEDQQDRDKESLQSEVKFLRELVDKLANHSSYKIVEVIKEVYRPYQTWPWYGTYITWSSGVQNLDSSSGRGLTVDNTTDGSNSILLASNSFTDIKTF